MLRVSVNSPSTGAQADCVVNRNTSENSHPSFCQTMSETSTTSTGPAPELGLRQLTEEESNHLVSFEDVLKQNESVFTVGDSIPSSVVDLSKHRFYYKVDGTEHSVTLPFTEAKAKEVFSRADQAPFGRGRETVVDHTYRRPRGLKVCEVAGAVH